MPQPILLLDFDGVVALQKDSRPDRHHKEWPEYSRCDAYIEKLNGRSYPHLLVWSPFVVQKLEDLNARGVEINWLSSIGNSVNGQIRWELGLPRWPVLGHELQEDHGHLATRQQMRWWKLNQVRDIFHRTGRHIIWIDDDINIIGLARKWIARMDYERLLALGPQPNVGLTPWHFQEIDQWLACQKDWVQNPVQRSGELRGWVTNIERACRVQHIPLHPSELTMYEATTRCRKKARLRPTRWERDSKLPVCANCKRRVPGE